MPKEKLGRLRGECRELVRGFGDFGGVYRESGCSAFAG
jgi:hypothetical protein